MHAMRARCRRKPGLQMQVKPRGILTQRPFSQPLRTPHCSGGSASAGGGAAVGGGGPYYSPTPPQLPPKSHNKNKPAKCDRDTPKIPLK